MIRTSRALTAAALACVLLAGCDSAGDSGGGSGSTPDSSAAAPSAAPGSPSATPSVGPAPGGPPIGDLDLHNFTFTGGCGFELPAAPVELRNGRQHNATPAAGGTRSRARLIKSRQLTIDHRSYLLAELRCTVGHQTLTGAHLIGIADGRPADLGIVATGTKVTVRTGGDRLQLRTRYRTVHDGPDQASGRTAYEIVMAGNTPVRIYPGDDRQEVGAAVAKLPAHGYDAGLVGINGYIYEPSESNWVVGLLQSRRQVITADTLGGYGTECWHPTVYTQAGQKLGADHLAFTGDDKVTGTLIDLDASSTAKAGERGSVPVPVSKPVSGMLIPANGVVPALATLTTQKAENPLGDPIVTSRAPADAWQDAWRFGAASGSEFELPVGAFAVDGRIALTGAWFTAPVDKADAGFGMRPLVDPAAVGEKTC